MLPSQIGRRNFGNCKVQRNSSELSFNACCETTGFAKGLERDNNQGNRSAYNKEHKEARRGREEEVEDDEEKLDVRMSAFQRKFPQLHFVLYADPAKLQAARCFEFGQTTPRCFVLTLLRVESTATTPPLPAGGVRRRGAGNGLQGQTTCFGMLDQLWARMSVGSVTQLGVAITWLSTVHSS